MTPILEALEADPQSESLPSVLMVVPGQFVNGKEIKTLKDAEPYLQQLKCARSISCVASLCLAHAVAGVASAKFTGLF